jgi:peptidoglycan/xylan/chitin deacetylase (PgdA/CDA1 family)
MTNHRAVAVISALALPGLLATASCTSTSAQSGLDAAAGAAGNAGAGGAAGGNGSGGAAVGEPSGLPVPPGPGNLPRPTGAPGNLNVLNWAGFQAAVTYTFDDAQPSQIEHYADLQATRARLTFYITSGNSGATSGFDTTFTQAVADGHEIGNHTVHHCHANLSGCSTGSATSIDGELDDCTSYIAGHFGQPQVWTAASPYGDTGYETPDKARFFLNRGVGSGLVAPVDNTDPFNLPCHAAVASETVDSFNTAIDGAHTAGRWLIFLVHTILPSTANWYAPIDISVVTGSIAHAQMMSDVWIDTMLNVGAYWRGQRSVATTTPTTAAGVQTWTWTLPAHFPARKFVRVTVDGGTLSQNGTAVPWDGHGYYEIALDAGSLTLGP